MTEMRRFRFNKFSILVFAACVGSTLWAGELSLQASVTAAAPSPSPPFKTELSALQIIDGGLGLVNVELPPEWVKSGKAMVVTGKLGARVFPLYPDRERTWQGLFGVPYGQAPGKMKLELTAKLADQTQSWQVEFEVIDGKYRSESLKVNPKHVSPPKSAMARIKRDGKETTAIYSAVRNAREWRGPFKRPLDSPLTSDYGAKRVYNGELKNAHKGVDFKAAVGTPIMTPAPGRVVLAKDLYYSGNTVILDHGYGLYTIYMHLSRFKVKKGAALSVGDVIGLSGATGRVSGPHLHWGAVVHGEKINPLELTTVIR